MGDYSVSETRHGYLAMEHNALKLAYEAMKETCGKLRAENEVLRRHVKSLARAVESTGCDYCPYGTDFDACSDTEALPHEKGCRLFDEMRKLGIEV